MAHHRPGDPPAWRGHALACKLHPIMGVRPVRVGQTYIVVRACPAERARIVVTVVVNLAGRSAPFLVVLAASWTGTDGSTLEQLGAGPGLLVLVVLVGLPGLAGVGDELRAAGLMWPARSMTLDADEEDPSAPTAAGMAGSTPPTEHRKAERPSVASSTATLMLWAEPPAEGARPRRPAIASATHERAPVASNDQSGGTR